MKHPSAELDGISMINKIRSEWPNNNKPIVAVVTASITQQECDKNNITILCSNQLMTGIDVRVRVQELIISEITSKYGPISYHSDNRVTTNADGTKLLIPIEATIDDCDEKAKQELAEATVFMGNLVELHQISKLINHELY